MLNLMFLRNYYISLTNSKKLKIMTNFTNISISAKGCKNYCTLLIMINVFDDNSIYLNVIDIDNNEPAVDEKIKNSHLLSIIKAFLAEVSVDEYDLIKSNLSAYLQSFVNLIAHWVIFFTFGESLQYTKIELINIRQH